MTRPDPDNERVRKACEVLSEHFDTVQIFATRHEPNEGGTINVAHGMGNWFARFGQCEDWILRTREEQKELVRIRLRKKCEEGEEE